MSESNPLALEPAVPASEAPAEERTGPQLGDDLFAGDTPDAPVEPTTPALRQTQQTGPQTLADLEGMDLTRVRIEELPPGLQDAARILQRTQRSYQADYTRKTQDLADQRRQFQEERQQYLAAIQRQSQPQAAGPAVDPVEELAARLERPEDKQGLYVVRDLFQRQINQQIQPILQQLQALTQSLPIMQQQVGTVQQRLHAEATAEAKSALDAAAEAYGDDAVQEHAQAILALHQQINPRTGKQWTPLEVVGALSGKAVAEVQQAQGAAVAQQRTAKARAGAPRSTPPANRGSGALSKREALQEVAAIFNS